MYYIVTTLTFAICVLIITVLYLLIRRFIKKHRTVDFKEKFVTDKKYRRKIIIENVCIFAVFITLVLLANYPIECYVISFDTIEDALSYKNISMENVLVYETDKTVFLEDTETYKVYSIAKKADKFGVVDFQSETYTYYEPESLNSVLIDPTYAKYNKATGETFYYIKVQPRGNQEYENSFLDNQQMQLAVMTNCNYQAFYYIDSNSPKDTFTFDTIDYSTIMKKA